MSPFLCSKAERLIEKQLIKGVQNIKKVQFKLTKIILFGKSKEAANISAYATRQCGFRWTVKCVKRSIRSDITWCCEESNNVTHVKRG